MSEQMKSGQLRSYETPLFAILRLSDGLLGIPGSGNDGFEPGEIPTIGGRKPGG